VFSNVWPGDANYDLIVDNIDLLYMGVAFGDTGYVRPGASMAFTAQPCQDWFFQFINGTNIKKADSDGNGTIDFPDTTAVSANYGLTHPFRHGQPGTNQYNSGPDLILQLPGGSAVPGSVMSVPIVFGTPGYPANIYGLAFTINYDPSMIQSGSLSIDFANSWIEPGTNHLSLVKDFPIVGECDAAFTRVDHNDISGDGIIGILNFTVANNASGYLHFSFSNIKAMLHNEIDVPVTANADSILTKVGEIQNNAFSIYPNPSTGNSTIWLHNDSHQNFKIEITNMTGQRVLLRTTTENKFVVDHSFLNKGIYIVKVTDNENRSFIDRLVLE
jgi:hypothetical protein